MSDQDQEQTPETGPEAETDSPPKRRRSAWIGLAVFLTGTALVYGAAGWAGVHAGELLMADQPSVRELQEHDNDGIARLEEIRPDLTFTGWWIDSRNNGGPPTMTGR